MAHQRVRFALSTVTQLRSFWPIVGVLGLRQVGKTTLLSETQKLAETVTLDDDEALEEASTTPKVFLSKRGEPLLIDEVQKAPKLFDALKLAIDRDRRPGRFFITGSTTFSSKLGIRESLTGRIGILHLHPMTLAEAHGMPFVPNVLLSPIQEKQQSKINGRFTIEAFSKNMIAGGLPVPLFARDPAQRSLYWKSWLDTTLYRDLRKLVGRNYDPDFAMRLLNQMASYFANGELPTLKHFPQSSTKLRPYLLAFEESFLLRKLSCHELGVGKEAWVFEDSGLLYYLLPKKSGEEVNQALARCYLLNELSAAHEYQAQPFPLVYIKSARGTPIDLVWNNIPIKVVARHSQLGWEERSLAAAMKKLRQKKGILVAPVSKPDLVADGISVVPWSYWS